MEEADTVGAADLSEEKSSAPFEEIKSKKPLRHGANVSMEGENFIIALDKNKVFSLTPGAYYVWIKCNGEKTVEELINDISKELGENPETAMSIDELRTPVTEIIHQLTNAGLLTMGQ